MGIDLTDLSEVRVLSVDDPRQAPTLLGGTFVTPWFRMDRDRSDDFERGTYLDSYPHPYGGETQYGDGLVEGFHLLGMTDFLLNHAVFCTDAAWIAWNYGLDHARFVTVIRDSDPFRLRGTVAGVESRPGQGHLITLDVVGEVKGREKPGFVCTLRVLWARAHGNGG